MDVLKKLASKNSDQKPYYGFAKLAIGYHKISCFRESHGEYGKNVVVELEKEIVFLPKYLCEKISGRDLEKLNECEETLYLFFGGRKKERKYVKYFNSFSSINKINLFFKQVLDCENRSRKQDEGRNEEET